MSFLYDYIWTRYCLFPFLFQTHGHFCEQFRALFNKSQGTFSEAGLVGLAAAEGGVGGEVSGEKTWQYFLEGTFISWRFHKRYQILITQTVLFKVLARWLLPRNISNKSLALFWWQVLTSSLSVISATRKEAINKILNFKLKYNNSSEVMEGRQCQIKCSISDFHRIAVQDLRKWRSVVTGTARVLGGAVV